MDRATEYRKARKTRDRAMVLLSLGIVLLMPPVAGVFELNEKIFGVPVTLVYLFSIWFFLIIATARLAGALTRSEESPDDRQ